MRHVIIAAVCALIGVAVVFAANAGEHGVGYKMPAKYYCPKHDDIAYVMEIAAVHGPQRASIVLRQNYEKGICFRAYNALVRLVEKMDRFEYQLRRRGEVPRTRGGHVWLVEAVSETWVGYLFVND